MTIKAATITAQDTGSGWLDMTEVSAPYKMDISVDIGGTTVVHLQRKRSWEADSAARDVQSFSADFEGLVEGVGKWYWRLHCKTANYNASTAVSIENA